MKYNCTGELIPQQDRKDVNEKILYLIQSGKAEEAGISQEDIYNAYTGDGGLHGLKYSDFGNYADYGKAKKEIENGQFFTPPAICQLIMEALAPKDTDVVADLTCGMGGFINFAPSESNFYGCELDPKAFSVARYLYPLANLTCKDIRAYKPGLQMDYVVGNPPFNLSWTVEGEQMLSQRYYCQKAAEVLKPLGIMAIIVPLSYLADSFSDQAMIRNMEERFSFLGQVCLDKDTFQAIGVTGYPTKIMFWQKKIDMEGWAARLYSTEVDFLPASALTPETLRTMYLEKARTDFYKYRPNILLEMARGRAMSNDFVYQVNRYLFHIKHNPKLKDKYVKCLEYINKFNTQTMPEGMSYNEWCRVRITEPKVLAYLRSTLGRQSQKPPRDEVRMVKRDYSIGMKGYSQKSARTLSEAQKAGTQIYEIVSQDMSPAAYGPYARMLRRRQRQFAIEQTPVAEMAEDPDIKAWLDDLTFFDKEQEKTIRLNAVQKRDINFVLQKRYFMLQWKQGCGKTLAGITTGMYRMQFQGVFCTWVVSNPISIYNNWNIVLPNYGISHVLVKRLSDLDKIRKGDFVLITTGFLSKYQRQIKKWIKIHNRKVCLCLDESDDISNPDSVRTKAVLNVFRRCGYKLLMTGTSTRNNITEFATQLELAYNNSVNMLSWAPDLYSYVREKGGNELVLSSRSNDWYGCPIPAYKPGYRLFSASHQPEKITVFGVGKQNQDIFNSDVLKDILDRFTITRSFKEVVGSNIFETPTQVTVRFSKAESQVYEKAINEFTQMRNSYFASTGSSRKDAMLYLVQQITLLLRISAAPNTVQEYQGGLPTKIAKTLDMLEERPDTYVAIGVRHKVVVEAYAAAIKARFPNRPLFVVTGDTTTMAQRRALKKKLFDSQNGILLCTQQSLPSSVNFEFVDEIIIPELHFNNSQMSQFYFRFIRYDSEHPKHVYFVTYLGSIESNQMQMVLAKEKLNLFMRSEDADLDEIYEMFGIDYNLLSMLMSRETDKDGKSYLRWGQQTVA